MQHVCGIENKIDKKWKVIVDHVKLFEPIECALSVYGVLYSYLIVVQLNTIKCGVRWTDSYKKSKQINNYCNPLYSEQNNTEHNLRNMQNIKMNMKIAEWPSGRANNYIIYKYIIDNPSLENDFQNKKQHCCWNIYYIVRLHLVFFLVIFPLSTLSA